MGGRDRLYNHIRQQHPDISRREVARALKEDPITQIHQPLNKRVTTRPIIVADRAKMAQIDLVDFQKLAGKNEGHRYLLVFVDLLSKFAAARPIKNKTQANVVAALEDILDSVPASWRPKTIQADNGSEFAKQMEKALAARQIKLIHSQAYNPRSQGAVERLNKTIKTALFNLMARHQSYKWIDFIEPLVENINGSKHESTGHTPLELMEKPLQPETIAAIHQRMERRRPKQKHRSYAVNDYVRVALVTESAIRKQTFRKKIMNNFSNDVFQIYAVSAPEAAGAQPQYLLTNLTTQRKSRKNTGAISFYRSQSRAKLLRRILSRPNRTRSRDQRNRSDIFLSNLGARLGRGSRLRRDCDHSRHGNTGFTKNDRHTCVHVEFVRDSLLFKSNRSLHSWSRIQIMRRVNFLFQDHAVFKSISHGDCEFG